MYHCFVHCLSSFLCTIFSVLLIMFTDTLLPTFLSSMLAFFIGCWFTTISINSSGHNAFSHVHLISFLILEPVFLMQVLPVVIDVGTNNQQLLENPQCELLFAQLDTEAGILDPFSRVCDLFD